MIKLTQKQQTILDYLQRYIGEHRRSPFLREIQDACRITSYKSVIDRLNALERKGFIKRTPSKHRAIHIHRKASAMLQPVMAVSGASFEPSRTSEPVPSTVAQAVPELAGEAGSGVVG